MAIDHVESGEIADVRPFGDKLNDAISTALFKSSELEVMRLVLRAGQTIPEHCVDGEMTVQCIEGVVEVQAHGSTQKVPAGHLMRLGANVPYQFHATEPTSMLVTIVIHQDPGKEPY